MPLFTNGGKLLLAAGKLSTSADCCCGDFGVFEFDDEIESESLYEVVLDNPFAFTLVSMEIVNLGEELLTNCHLFWGAQGDSVTPVTFTGGDFGGAPDPNSYPTEAFGSPPFGVFAMFCHQRVPALGYLQLNIGDFADSNVLFSGLSARFYYTRS